MIRLSVNINKLATIRNARGGNNPDILQFAGLIQGFGADGITVHPRPDQRHIRYDDARALRSIVNTELNIEGNPTEPTFVELVLDVLPEQVTLVPDAVDQQTSNHGWNTIEHREFLQSIISVFKDNGIRVSIFVDPIPEMVQGAAETGTDRIELYTESYARGFEQGNKESVILPYVKAASIAQQLGLGINAGHDLDMQNLGFFANNIQGLMEVSIGHALICDALTYGMENTVQLYKRQLS